MCTPKVGLLDIARSGTQPYSLWNHNQNHIVIKNFAQSETSQEIGYSLKVGSYYIARSRVRPIVVENPKNIKSTLN